MNKYTIKLILAKHAENKHGHHPIYIRIIISRKVAYLSTGIYIDQKHWDAKNERIKDSHTMAPLYNPDITNRKVTLVNKIVNLQIKGEQVSAADLKKGFYSNKHNNIFDFIDQFSDQVKHKRKPGTLENYRKHVLKLEQFHGSRNLSFEEISIDYLVRYENHLRETVGANYTHALFKTLKSFFNAARKQELITNYPFTKYENPVYKPPVKDYLSLKEISKFEQFADETSDNTLKQVAVYFLLGCFTGLRISDWLGFDIKMHVINDRIKLQATKNGELIIMPISKPLERNLERIRATPLSLEEPTINKQLKTIASLLNIPKHITSHTGRHTFAITMCAEQGISSETCATLMGITNETCIENYYRITPIKILSETSRAWESLV